MSATDEVIFLKALLVDDEIPNIENLAILIGKHCREIQVEGTARTISAAVDFLKTHTVDVVFLDIEMPGETGFDLLPHLKGKNISVVFVTAHSKYALKALKASATDYLLKPIDIDELKLTGEKLLLMKNNNDLSTARKEERYTTLAETIQSKKKLEKLILPHQRGFKIVNTSEIIYLEGDNSYTTVFSSTEAPIVVTRTLKDFEQMLEGDTSFFRIHKSYIVNLKYNREFVSEDGGYAILSGKQKLPVSRRRLAEFMIAVKKEGTNSKE